MKDMKKMKKIKYVQIEPAMIMTDDETQSYSAKQFGCYCRLILHLLCNDGKAKFDINKLAKICNCRRNFADVWRKIAHRFQLNRNTITNKHVTQELKRARNFMQHQSNAGLASAQARRARFNRGSTPVQPSKVK